MVNDPKDPTKEPKMKLFHPVKSCFGSFKAKYADFKLNRGARVYACMRAHMHILSSYILRVCMCVPMRRACAHLLEPVHARMSTCTHRLAR